MKNLIKIFLLVVATGLYAQKVSFTVGNVLPGELDMQGFLLSDKTDIELTGLGTSFDEWNDYLSYYSWILNSKTREIVWRSKDCDDYAEDEGDYDIDKKLSLAPGSYEIYFVAVTNNRKSFSNGIGAIQALFNRHKPNIKKFRKKYFVKVSGNLLERNAEKLVDSLNEKAIVSIVRVGDSENIKREFSLSKSTSVDIYGVGEGVRSEFYDFGFIYDAIHHKRVWMFNRHDGKYAGGGKKNIEEHTTIVLPKGSYYVQYKSDDSHSFDEWNVAPPNDPQYWGIVLKLSDEKDRANLIPFRSNNILKPIIEIVKVEEDEFITKGFSIKKPLKVRVLSIGEGRSDLVDYGWIENADTRETVWLMNKNNTEYAGGSKKNRMFDGIIELPKGNYFVFYRTDDSHNYDDWNEPPPFEENRWGITIWPINKEDVKYIKIFDAHKYRSKNLIVSISNVGDEEDLSKRFNINNRTNIRIIALGEGSGGELVDYAWITNRNGKIVWEMKYDETSHAGGARKNRIFNDTITLKSGKYILHYKSDDSHSFEDWNDTPPNNPEMYGVTILNETSK